METFKKYPIIQIGDDAQDDSEPLGTKPKFWCEDEKFLFKIGRPETGENWAEKIACELGRLLGLPCVHYDFACYKGTLGVVSSNFVPENGYLVHGNELLAQIDEMYPYNQFYHVKEYTVSAVLGALKQEEAKVPLSFKGIEGIQSGIDVFIGYLLFDAWIANQDRHAQNWGLIYVEGESSGYLTPTYDHAASMGCHGNDTLRKRLLELKDKSRNIENFIKRARSPFYDCKDKPKQIKTMDVFYKAAKYTPNAGLAWLNKLDQIKEADLVDAFNKVPTEEISELSIDFAIKILMLNKKRILEQKGVLG